jgi:hypothetical protein
LWWKVAQARGRHDPAVAGPVSLTTGKVRVEAEASEHTSDQADRTQEKQREARTIDYVGYVARFSKFYPMER